ncbi:MAG: peptide chain release factor 1 [Cyanobacteria bacterium J06559_3]
MRDPLWRLKTLPWGILLQNALLTVTVATLLDIALQLLLVAIAHANIGSAGQLLPGGGLSSLLLELIVSGGIGALAVILMERCFRQVLLDAARLWALFACLVLALYLKTLLPIPALFLARYRISVLGLLLGLFAQGSRYWRR